MHLFSALQVIFSQTSELLERQSSMASSTEEVSGTGNDLSTDSKGGQGGAGGGGGGHDTTDTEQKFGMYMREFDFLEYELESLEVSTRIMVCKGTRDKTSTQNLRVFWRF